MPPLDDKNFLTLLFSKLKEEATTLIIGLISALGAVITNYVVKNIILFFVCIGIVTLCILWIVFKKIQSKKKPRKLPTEPTPETSRSYIRGLLPFEKGDKLLGRESERGKINTIINSLNFRFGYISGEAGSGKTSFLRSILLEEVEKKGNFPLYIPEIKADLIETIKKAISKEIGIIPLDENLKEYFRLLQERLGRPIVLIIDQFEQYFITFKSEGERKDNVKEVVQVYSDEELNVRVLVALRKEFVADLQDFSPQISQPTDTKYCLSLKNWDVEIAKKVLKTITTSDTLRFSDELCIELINDLSDEGFVRPVELQIVTQKLVERNVNDMTAYKVQKRARGILALYIEEAIASTNSHNIELDKEVSKIILKSLCDVKNDTKRLIGLKTAEIENLVKNTLLNSQQKHLVTSENVLSESIHSSIARLINQYIIKHDDEEKINLVHDYIVGPIRLATVKTETVEEKADGLLKQYIEQQNAVSNTTIPWKHYRYIKKYSSDSKKHAPNSLKILKRTRRKHYLFVTIPFVAVIFVLAIFHPIKEVRSSSIYSFKKAKFTIIKNNKIIIAQTRDSLFILQNNIGLRLIKQIPFLKGHFEVSKYGKWLFVKDSNSGYLYKNYGDSLFEKKITFSDGPIKVESGNFVDYGFSDDETTFYFFDNFGNLHIADLLQENPNPISQPVLRNFSDILSKNTSTYIEGFSSSSKYLYGYRVKYERNTTTSSIFIIPVSHQNSIRSKDLIKNVTEGSIRSISISHNDSLLAFGLRNKLYFSNLNNIFKPIDFSTLHPVIVDTSHYYDNNGIDITNNYLYDFQASFSPDNNWIFARTNLGITYSLFIRDSALFNIDVPQKQGVNSNTSFQFSSDGKFCSFFDRTNELLFIPLSDIRTKSPFKPFHIGGEGFKKLKLNSSCRYLLGYNVSGDIYAWAVGASPDSSKCLVHYINDYDINTYWCKSDEFIYSFANDRLHYGNISHELNQLNVKIGSSIKDIAISIDGSKLIVLSEDEIFTVERKEYLLGIVPIKDEVWPEISYSEKNKF